VLKQYYRGDEMIGIYLLTNKINNKKYVGKSIHIRKRIGEHFREARYERNADRPLYQDIRRYGKKNFIVEILEQCSENELAGKEQYYYEKLNPEYNLKSPDSSFYTEETKHKIGIKSRERMLANNPMSNKEIKKKHSEIMKSDELRNKMSKIVNQPKFKTQMIKNQPNRKPIVMLDKETLELKREFLSIRRAVDWLRENGYPKADRKSVRQCCEEEHRYCYNHRWRYGGYGEEKGFSPASTQYPKIVLHGRERKTQAII